MSNPQNPWTNISWSNTIAECDKGYRVNIGKHEFEFGSEEYVNYINRNDKEREKGEKSRPVKLTFENCLPEPYYGDKDSEVYLLNMNPGVPDLPDFCQENDNHGRYVDFYRAMMNHQPMTPGLLYDSVEKTIIYNPSEYNKIIDEIIEGNKTKLFKKHKEQFPLRPHAGDVWQRIAWKKLRETLKRDPRLFIIEFFPYHSTSGFAFPKDLPSNDYRDSLIRQAIDKEKLIVIMRQEKKWYKIEKDNLGNDLKNYPNKITLSCKGRIWLTPGNFVIPSNLSLKDILEKF